MHFNLLFLIREYIDVLLSLKVGISSTPFFLYFNFEENYEYFKLYKRKYT